MLAASLQSPPVEEVLFQRDEMANLVWAVERIVEGPTGRSYNRFEAFQGEQRRPEPTAASPGSERHTPIAYHLASHVPDYWIPLVLVQTEDGSRAIRLLRGAMPRLQPDGTQAPSLPQGRILEPDRDLRLYEEEVARAGARVTRAYQYARWIDGSTHLWIGRRKRPGCGEGLSGLRFDLVDPVTQPPSL